MSLTLNIENINRSKEVDWTSLKKDEGLTKEPDTLDFVIKETPSKTVPALGNIVQLIDDSDKVFEGIIVERSESIIGGKLVGWQIGCKDYTHTLDKLLVSKRYESMSAREIIVDIIGTFTDGTFTYTNVPMGTPEIESIRFNYEPVSKALQQIADVTGWDWYVDYDKDVHFFAEETKDAPFGLTDTNDNFEWRTLEFDRNILNLTNSVIVRGGEYLSEIFEAGAVDKYEADGTRDTFQLAYKYTNIVVKKNGVAQTIGIDNISDPLAVQVLYNFNEKFIRFTTTPAVEDDVVVYGKAHIPVIARVRDQVSIGTYGEYQKLEINKNITSIGEALSYGKAKLLEWSEGAYEGKFRTTKKGLVTGQFITINSVLRNINKAFKINKIRAKTRTPGTLEYEVSILASGNITLTDIMVELLARERKNISISDDEIIQRLENMSEDFSIADILGTPTTSTPPYVWGPSIENTATWDFSTYS